MILQNMAVALLCGLISATVTTTVLKGLDAWSRKKPPYQATQKDVDLFLNRMMFKTWSDNVRFVELKIDCFRFDFRPNNPEGLETQTQSELIEYQKTLDLRRLHAVTKLYIWLVQHDIEFNLHWAYNDQLPVWYNIKQMHTVSRLLQNLSKMDRQALLDYNLAEDTVAARQ